MIDTTAKRSHEMDFEYRWCNKQAWSRNWSSFIISVRSDHRGGTRIEQRITNNKVEYMAPICGLKLAQKLGIQNLRVYVDS